LHGGCDILVATPGRLNDFIDRTYISLKACRYLAIDEADRMLDMGFLPQLRQIVNGKDMPKERETVMFSATFPKEIRVLANDFLNRHVFLTLGRAGAASNFIT
jgi:ATP-dependent RNA helicase DDX3X